MSFIDLHTHSRFSDGTLSPTELVKLAKEIGLDAIALTDHNTVAGDAEFLSAGKKYNVNTIAGIELSTEYEGQEVHMVGLFIRPEYFESVEKFAAKNQEYKEISNRNLIKNLQDAGYDITLEAVVSHSGNSNINRANIAAYLLFKGYISSVKEGFETILSEEYGYYIPGGKIETVEALHFLNSIRAVSVWAHPFISVDDHEEVTRIAGILASEGLKAIETRYSLYDKETEEKADQLTDSLNLLKSGGSDFHGENKPYIALKTGTGTLAVPSEYCEKMKSLL